MLHTTLPTRFGVGVGQLINKLAQFNEHLHRQTTNIQFWRDFVNDYFEPNAIYKYIVWHKADNSSGFQLFQISRHTLPRYFYLLYSCSISSIDYFLENPRELSLDDHTYLLLSTKTNVEYTYENGGCIVTKGLLRITFNGDLKILLWEFEARRHIEYLPLSKIKESIGQDKEIQFENLPFCQVNEFGLPPSVMRCFEISEVLNSKNDLISFCIEHELSPLMSLEQYNQLCSSKTQQNSARS